MHTRDMRVHTLSVRMRALCLRVHTCVCVHKLKVSYSLSFPKVSLSFHK